MCKSFVAILWIVFSSEDTLSRLTSATSFSVQVLAKVLAGVASCFKRKGNVLNFIRVDVGNKNITVLNRSRHQNVRTLYQNMSSILTKIFQFSYDRTKTNFQQIFWARFLTVLVVLITGTLIPKSMNNENGRVRTVISTLIKGFL